MYIVRSAVGVVEAEAGRRRLTPSALVAEIVEAWARARADAPPSRRLTVCRATGCERPVYARGLCRPHEVQERKGQLLRPIQQRLEQQVQMGSLRLPVEIARQLRAAATASGRTVPELIRRALAGALDDVAALAVAEGRGRGGETVRLGMLRLPADLAQRLSVTAQELGVSVAEVVRRAVELTRPGHSDR